MERIDRNAGQELKTSLRLVILAASLGMPFFAITGGPALTGFIRDMGANDFVYSLIMSMPVFGAVLQVFAAYIMETTAKRRSFFLISGLVHRLLWIPIALTPYLFSYDRSHTGIWTATALIAVSAVANSILGLSFNSWMGSLVPAEIKGRFFSRRAMIITITSGLGALLSGLLLDAFPGFPGFTAVFIIGGLLGASDIATYFWIKHPHMEKPVQRLPFFKLMGETWRDRNYMRFIAFVSLWYFGVNFAGPFFNVYMIEELHMNFLVISLFAQVAGNIATILFIRKWGSLADKYGCKPVMAICCWVIIVLPLIWLFATPGSTWVVLIINFLSGTFWPGFDMNAANQSIWLAPERNRSSYIATYALIVALIGTGAAFICGGAFMEYTKNLISNLDLPFIMGQKLSNYHFLFVISSLVRFLALILLFKAYREDSSQTPSKIISDVRANIRTRLKLQG